MRNILKQPIDHADVQGILGAHREALLLPPLGAAAWREAFAKPAVGQWMLPIRALAEREAGEPLPCLTDELYADFHKTGTRLHFEDIYFERRRRLARAALCALQDADQPQRWLSSVTAKLQEVFAEPAWALPAHTTDPSGQEPGTLDLFAAETANLMGEMITLFGAVLPPAFVRQIKARLRTEIFENCLDRAYWWMTAPMNWNAVCHQGMLGAALAVEEDLALVARLVLQARHGLPFFLGGFTADGGCTEGPAYWEYGFGWFCELNRQLEVRSGGELSLVEGDPHVREIAKYGPRLSLANAHLVNFADGAATGPLRPALLQYLGERLDDEVCRTLAYVNFQYLARHGQDVHDERCDLLGLTRLFLACPADLARTVVLPHEDVLLKDLAVLVARGTDRAGHRWEFAAKAGHNGEHHNHNDCGSYLLNIDGERRLTEIGAPEYVKAFFGPERYAFLAARTLGHALPVINGCEQQAGREYAAQITAYHHAGPELLLRMDLTRCYPARAECDQCVREFRLRKDAGELRIEDRVVLRAPRALETAVITESPVQIGQGGAIITGAGVALEIAPEAGSVIARVDPQSYSAPTGRPASVNRIVIVPARLAGQVVLAYTVRLARAG